MYKTVSLALALALFASTAFAQQYGDLEGQFIFKGTPPTPAKIVPDKDVAVCGKHPLFVEKVVVDPQSKGISGIVVYLFTTPTTKINVHPDLAKPSEEGVLVDNKKQAVRCLGQETPQAPQQQ